MSDDAACREKLAVIAVGSSVAVSALAGAPPPPGVLEAAVGAYGWLSALRGKRAAERDAVISRLADDLATDWAAWVEGPDPAARASARQSFAEVIDRCQPAPGEIVGRRLDADALAAAMLRRAEAALPLVYADTNPRNSDAHLARRFFLHVATRAYARLLADREFMDRLVPDLWREVLGTQAGMDAKLDAQSETLAKIMAKLEAMGAMADAAQAGVPREAVIEIARRFAPGVADEAQALREIGNAVSIAVRVQQEGAQGTNLGDFVDEVLRRVAELNRAARFDDAAEETERAFAEWERSEAERAAASRAVGVRLLEAGIEQDALRNASAAAAQKVARKVMLETPDPVARFGALLAMWSEWYERGRNREVNFDLLVAIEVAHIVQSHAASAEERGAALNNLGTTLFTLGEREIADSHLKLSLDAYCKALKEFTVENNPLQWAATKDNIGNALGTIGVRKSDAAALEQAIVAHQSALSVRRRELVPRDWSRTKHNLGIAFRRLGERRTEANFLVASIDAFEDSLRECPPIDFPDEWASTQAGLGTSFRILGSRSTDSTLFKRAILAYRNALKFQTRERVPLAWATTQCCLGDVLLELGKREEKLAWLEQALSAYRAAFEMYSRESTPVQWASTVCDIGNALVMLGSRESGVAKIREAIEGFQNSLDYFSRDGLPLEWAMIQNNLGNALMALGEREEGAEALERAVLAYNEALKERSRTRTPFDWAMTQHNLGAALGKIGEREAGTARLHQAVSAYHRALEERTRDIVPFQWATTQNNLGVSLEHIGEREADRVYLTDAIGAYRNALEVFAAMWATKLARGARANLARAEALIARLRGESG